jgi:hypothetical protein
VWAAADEPEQTVLDCLAVLPEQAGARLVDAALGRLVGKDLLHDRYLTMIRQAITDLDRR